jgi:POT family proton-dependent oligopeptide transporter
MSPAIAYKSIFPSLYSFVSCAQTSPCFKSTVLNKFFATMPADNMDNMIRATHDPSVVILTDEKHELSPEAHVVAPPAVVAGKAVKANPGYFYNQGEADEDGHVGQEGDEWPTEEDLHTLRRVPDKISVSAYTVAIIELCERFSYYGTQVLCTFLPSPRMIKD